MARGLTTTEPATVAVDGRDILRLVPETGRVRVDLVMPGIGRSVEVTGAPGTAVHALDDAATRGGTNPSRVHAAARRALSATAEIAGAWCPDTETTLLTLFGGASYPLLAAAYEAGAGPIRSVPRWSDAILAEPDPRHAARLAFGQKATRPVVAAFARSLVRVEPAPVDLSRLALALIGGDVLEPDQLATVLPAAGPSWPDRSLPAPRQLERARAVTKRWGPERTLGYLLQAAADDAARRLLIECVDHAIDLQFHAPIHLPAGLEDLRAVYLLQIRSTAETSRAAPRRRRAPRHATRPARTEQRDRVDYGQLLAPRVRSLTPITASTPIRHPGWLRNVDGSSVGGFTFVLPGTCGDLERWSQAMANCLDTFKSAAVEGASHLVGILADGRHRYVLEVGPDRAIRQFSGRANRPVVRSDHDEIIAHLRSRSVLQRPIA